MKNKTIIGKVECANCNKDCDLIENKHPTEKQLSNPYYFKEYYYCKECKHYGNEEKNKIFNR